MKFILGSGSPRRKELLAQIGVVPDAIRAPDINEDPHRGELPRPYCVRMAREKVMAVKAGADEVVLCADTTVALGRRILGKPADAGQAAQFLLALSGRRHRVITAVAVLGTLSMVSNWASRNSAQELSVGSSTIFLYGASWTTRKGKSPWRQSSRQHLIIAGRSVRYW